MNKESWIITVTILAVLSAAGWGIWRVRTTNNNTHIATADEVAPQPSHQDKPITPTKRNVDKSDLAERMPPFTAFNFFFRGPTRATDTDLHSLIQSNRSHQLANQVGVIR